MQQSRKDNQTKQQKCSKTGLLNYREVLFVPVSLFLMLSLTSCASESPRLIEPLPIPQTLFTKCYAPDYWVKTYGDYPGYVAELLAVIEQCNNQISAIEKIESTRPLEYSSVK